MIDIARDFSDIPGGRFPSDGPYNGQDFRDRFLAPALEQGQVEVVMDNTEGFGSSFLEEAFGGLVRRYAFAASVIHSNLKLVANTAAARRYKRMAEMFIEEALKVRDGGVKAPGADHHLS